MLHALSNPKKLLDQNIETAIIDLVKQVATRLTRDALKSDDTIIKKIVREALSLLPLDTKHVVITANVRDMQLLQELLCDVSEFHCDLKEDNDLYDGDIRVQSECCEIDASISARLDTIMEQIIDDHR